MRIGVWFLLVSSVLIAGCAGPAGPKVDTGPSPVVARPSTLAPVGPVAVTPAPAPAPRPKAEAWDPPGGVKRHWRYIVIHHSASDIGSLDKIDHWHKAKGWDGCGYHFVIGNGTNSSDGLIQVSARWNEQAIGAHTRMAERYARDRGLDSNFYNECGIGIVLVGNFDKSAPDARQMASLAKLVRYLMDRCQIPESRVVTHGTVDQTHCPGRYFSRTQLLLAVRTLRALADSGADGSSSGG